MRQKGLTLLELLVVIVILSLMMGISISLFTNANKDLGVRSSANHVVSLLRSVRDHARIRSEPAWVALNPSENSIHVLTQETYGEWHFEDRLIHVDQIGDMSEHLTFDLAQGAVRYEDVVPHRS